MPAVYRAAKRSEAVLVHGALHRDSERSDESLVQGHDPQYALAVGSLQRMEDSVFLLGYKRRTDRPSPSCR